MPKLFISRDVDHQGPFHALMDSQWSVTGRSLIKIKYRSFELPTNFSWMFFYSQHGVRAFFKNVSSAAVKDVKVGAFGPKTAASIEAHMPVHFIGNGKGVEVAQAFEVVAAHERVLFARAQNSMRSVQSRVSTIHTVDLVVYDNEVDLSSGIPEHDWAVLTSPLNAKTYMHHTKGTAEKNLVAIGASTAQALYDLGATKVIVPDNPSEESIVTLLLQCDIYHTIAS
ncbi:MAG: uroporphyrinogen-III synthase [Saprospiraceae bacterium]|nr:uroporphyrinogen-III synthase [Saprospiraceae bacterium]